MLKILLVTTSYPISINSVSGIFIKRLVESLLKRTHVTVLTPADAHSRCSDQNGDEHVVKCHYAPFSFQILAHSPGGIPAKIRANRLATLLVPMLILSMMRHIYRESKRVDVIHCNWAVSGNLAVLLRWAINKPIVVTLRGEDVKINGRGLRYRLIENCLKYSDKVVLVGDEMQNDLRHLFPQYVSKMQTIHNGVDSLFLNTNASDLSHNEAIRFVAVGSLIPRKNHLYLLSALAILKRKGIPFHFDIIGDGETYKEIERYTCENGLSKSVKMHGSLSPVDVADVLSRAHVFITASRHEGRPNAVIEAMAVGLSVLASNIPGHRELINESRCGELFELDQLEDLTNKLEIFIDKIDYIGTYGQRAKNYILKSDLTWDSCAKSYISIFEELVTS